MAMLLLLARMLLRGAAPPGRLDDLLGDWEEVHARRVARLGPLAARWASLLDAAVVSGALLIDRFKHKRTSSPRAAKLGSPLAKILGTLAADLRWAVRRLRSEPGFSAVAVLTLAIGIGGTSAIFSAVNAILFQPLPYPEASRLAAIWEVGSDGLRIDGTFGMYRTLADRSRSFEGMAAYKPWQPTVSGAQQPERLTGQRVSADYFRVLSTSAGLGRDFQASEDRIEGAKVVMLSDALWRRLFNADPAILGRPVSLDGDPYSVIGILPAGFRDLLAPQAEIWAPLQYGLSQGRAWGHHLRLVGRMRQGTAIQQATRELDEIGRAVLDEQHPDTYGPEVRFQVQPLRDDLTQAVKPALLAVLAAVALVLVIACLNVSNLLLARGVRRQGEFALRAALGAGRLRLVRQLLTESLLLAALGGAAGLAVALAGVQLLVAASPPELPRLAEVAPDVSLFAFGLGITTLSGLAFGLLPALQAARGGLQWHLQAGRGRLAAGHLLARNGLVVAEVALSIVLLVSSGLLLRSLERFFAVEPGFDSSRLLTMQIQVAGHRFDEQGETRRFFAAALEAIREVPGATAAALTSQLPLSGDADLYGLRFDPSPYQDPGELRGTFRYAVSPGYFEAMGIPLSRGRSFDGHDGQGAPPVAIISQSLAKRRLPGLDPLGRQLHIGAAPQLYTVVGIVGDVRQLSLAVDDSEAVYTTVEQWPFTDRVMSLAVRARGDAAGLTTAVRQAVWSVDKNQAVARVATMEQLVAASASQRRFALLLFESFAAAALLLAAAGIYAVLTGRVAERHQEMGVRSALGASRGRIVRLIVRQGLTLTGIGTAIGIAAAALATEAITALLFGVSALDPATYLAVAALVAAVALLACSIPAWRAARVDPASALRAE